MYASQQGDVAIIHSSGDNVKLSVYFDVRRLLQPSDDHQPLVLPPNSTKVIDYHPNSIPEEPSVFYGVRTMNPESTVRDGQFPMLSRFWPEPPLGDQEDPREREGIAAHWFPMGRVIQSMKESRLDQELPVLRRCRFPVSEGNWTCFDNWYCGSQKRHAIRFMITYDRNLGPPISTVELLSIPGPDDGETQRGDGLENRMKQLDLPIHSVASCSYAIFSDDAGVLAIVGAWEPVAGRTVYLFDF